MAASGDPDSVTPTLPEARGGAASFPQPPLDSPRIPVVGGGGPSPLPIMPTPGSFLPFPGNLLSWGPAPCNPGPEAEAEVRQPGAPGRQPLTMALREEAAHSSPLLPPSVAPAELVATEELFIV